MEAVPSATLVASRVGDDLLLPTRNRRLGLNESDFGARRATTPRARGRHGDPGGRDAIRSVPPRGARGGYARDAIERCVCDGARPTRTPMSRSLIRRGRARAPSPVERPPPTTLVARAHLSPPPHRFDSATTRPRTRTPRKTTPRRYPAARFVSPAARRSPRAASYRPRSARQPRAPSARTTTTPPAHASPPPRAAPSSLSRPVASSEPSATRTTSSASSAHSSAPSPAPTPIHPSRASRVSHGPQTDPPSPSSSARATSTSSPASARACTPNARATDPWARGRSRGNRPRARPRRRMGSRRRARVLTPETHRETRAPRGGWRRG